LLIIVIVGLVIGAAGIGIRQLTNPNHLVSLPVNLTPLNAPKPSGHPITPSVTTTTMAPLPSPAGFVMMKGSDGERVGVKLTGGPTRVRLACSSTPLDVVHLVIENLGPFTVATNPGDYTSSVSVVSGSQDFRGAPPKCGDNYPPCRTSVATMHLTPDQSSTWCPLVSVPTTITSHEVSLDLVELLGGDFIVTPDGGSPTDGIVEWIGARAVTFP
jgi:hypothetical protein